MQFAEHKLDNGLNVVVEHNPLAHSTAVGFFVGAGARDETDDVAGVSHFLEHMVFKGTPTRTADDVNREFDEMGADYNAYTSEESTVYYAAVLPELQNRAIELLGDILRPTLREDDFDTEKKVIIEEIQMYADQPPFLADDMIKEMHYHDHPLGRSVLGTVESIERLSVDQMRAYFAQRYAPSNITVAAAGRVDIDGLLKQLQQRCGEWEPFDAQRDRPAYEGVGDFRVVHRDRAVHEYVLQLANAPGAADDMRFAAKLLATAVGDDSGSQLYWELVDSGLAEHASLSYYPYQGAGLFMTYLSCEPEAAADNLQRITDVIRAVERDGITAEELALCKSKVSSRAVLAAERPRGRLFAVGSNWINGRGYRSLADDLVALAGVSLDDVSEIIKQYPLSRATTLAIGPLESMDRPK